jgi:hypothetical protein
MRGLDEATDKYLTTLVETRVQQDRWKKIMEDAKQVTEQARTPLEKLNDTVAELGRLFLLGAITPKTFFQAVDKAQEEFKETEKKARKAREEIQKFDAALYGSAEARARVLSFRDMVTGVRTPGLPNSPTLNQPGVPARRTEEVDILKDIRGILGNMNNRDYVLLEPVELK